MNSTSVVLFSHLLPFPDPIIRELEDLVWAFTLFLGQVEVRDLLIYLYRQCHDIYDEHIDNNIW